MKHTVEISPETGALGSRRVQEAGEGFVVAIARALGVYVAELGRAFLAARHAFRKARKSSLPFHARVPLGDPVLARLDNGQGNPEDQLPQDEPSLLIYRTEGGRYFTDTMLSQGKVPGLGGARITFASEISDERAEELCVQLDALAMDVALTENEQLIRTVLRRHLEDRYAT